MTVQGAPAASTSTPSKPLTRVSSCSPVSRQEPLDAEGRYPPGSINARVQERLRGYAQLMRSYPRIQP